MTWLLVLLFVSSAHGAKIPSKAKVEGITDFSGGLNTQISPHQLDKKFSPDTRNVLIDEKPGSLVTRGGFEIIGSTMVLADIRVLFTYAKEDGSKKFIISDSSLVLQTQDFQVYVFISSNLNTTVNLQIAQAREKVWFTNGSDSVFTWDDTNKKVLDGNGGTPAVPQGKFIITYQNRVWVANTATNRSAIHFSALSSTDGIIIAPDDARAWPSVNQLNVGQGDGQVITGMWVQNGQLHIAKERSLYTIFGTNAFNYVDRKIDAQVGLTSQNTIKVLDGNSYLLGEDGIYKGITRISDSIAPNIEEVRRDSTLIVENDWDTESEFLEGNVNYASSVTFGGFVTMRYEDAYANNISAAEPSGDVLTIDSSEPSSIRGILVTTNTIPVGFQGYVHTISFWGRCSNSPCPMQIKVTNDRTGSFTDFNPGSLPVFSTFSIFTLRLGQAGAHPDTVFDKDELEANISSLTITIARTVGFTTEVFEFYPTTTAGNATILLTPASTVHYQSEVATITETISSWGSFDGVVNTNAGSVDFFIRSSTSAVNITTQTWSPIGLGARIKVPTINNYIQWASTISGASSVTVTNIDRVFIDHIEGQGSNTRAFAETWKNRYWLTVSTESTGNFPVTYVKSKITNPNPNAWMRFEIPIRSYTKDASDVLYGGAVSTGVIYRLDFGTNDNGEPIDAFWKTPEMVLGSNFQDKKIWGYLIDADKESNKILSLGVSVEGGSFTVRSLDLDGTGRFVQEDVKGVKDKGNSFQWKIQNNQLDKNLNFHNLGVVYIPMETISDR